MLSAEKIEIIEAKAENVLRSAYDGGSLEIPVNLGKVADRNGLTLTSATFKNSDVLGLFDRKERAIYIAQDTPFPRMAFTIAHEIGHYVLHQNKEKDIFLRLEEINIDMQSKEEEQEANWFASSLLMPRSTVLEFWTFPYEIDVQSKIEKLSLIFGVSKTAMLYRLKNLGLV